jgi:hypothetical protein
MRDSTKQFRAAKRKDSKANIGFDTADQAHAPLEVGQDETLQDSECNS